MRLTNFIIIILIFSLVSFAIETETEIDVLKIENDYTIEKTQTSDPEGEETTPVLETIVDDNGTIKRFSLKLRKGDIVIEANKEHLTRDANAHLGDGFFEGNVLLKMIIHDNIIDGPIILWADKVELANNFTQITAEGNIRLVVPFIYEDNDPPILPILITAGSFSYNKNAIDKENVILLNDVSVVPYKNEFETITHAKITAKSIMRDGENKMTLSRLHASLFGINFLTVPKYVWYDNERNNTLLGDLIKVPEVILGGNNIIQINYSDNINIDKNLSFNFDVGYNPKEAFDWKLSLDYYTAIGNIPIKASIIQSHAEKDIGKNWLTREAYREYNFDKQKINRTPAFRLSTDKKINLYKGITTGIVLSGGRFNDNLIDAKKNAAYGIATLETPKHNILKDGRLSIRGQYGLRYALYEENDSTVTTVYGATIDTDFDAPLYLSTSYLRYSQSGNTPFLFDKLLIEDLILTEIDYKILDKYGNRLKANIAYSYSPNEKSYNSSKFGLIYSDTFFSYGASYNTMDNTIGFSINFSNNFSVRSNSTTVRFPFQYR